ncbi:hypothetical protein PHMEG_00015653 [Phytophthora megakarya]|uniref:Uncharacterized protein n=1 Tax=Phytophthora megakarya TaxID=4795 RepID=A0A225W2V3_9STRA|nr:hypothetical protein PHMEG_00015653 [Phytophthora megakarya]
MITRRQEPTDAPASPSLSATTAPKRAASKPLSDGTLNEARKGKKKTVKRASPAPTPTEPEKNSDRGPAINVRSELEEKAPPRAAKKPKKATTAREPGAASREDGFDLSKFMASFQPGTGSVTAPPVTADPLPMLPSPPAFPEGPSIVDELLALKEEVLRLRGLVGAQATTPGNPMTMGTPTAPNAKDELPPGDVGLDCIKFVVTPAVLMAIFSGRLGSRGLTLMHFRESTELDTLEDGSSNANFSSDFSPSAALPSANARCSSSREREIPHDTYGIFHQTSCDVAETPVRQPPFNSAEEGVEVRLPNKPLIQHVRPPNHDSARARNNILRKTIRKEQDASRCLVLDAYLIEKWPEVVISPFGVVDKGNEDAITSGRTIHDISYPEGESVNDCTDPASLTKPDYVHCAAVATEILRVKWEHPNTEVDVMAGDVASAFRNISIHSNSVFLFAGRIEEENVIVIEMSAPFGWTESHGFYEIADDHINVAANIGTSFEDMNRSLRFAMAAILGAEAINDEKFTSWKILQRVLGLEFDSVAEIVSMPASKISKARNIVASAYFPRSLTRKIYRSLMGSLQHVASCIRAARPFLQRLRVRESNLHLFQIISVTEDMKQDVLWWWLVLHDPQLNGVSLEYFNTLPLPNVVVEVDASDFGLYALDFSERFALTHQFSPAETALISDFKSGSSNGFDINFREILTCAFAVNEWDKRWSSKSSHGRRPVHVHFQIDNTSAVGDKTSSHREIREPK